ncbi:AraC family transcriptional regulator [Acinetobacter gerneri]|uniref:helix-turn-helix transcriptional regulator n=1 Tax=Acinetobacter gerneri TaxID=202952 RepID=UPI002935A017|nr:AraC family transcriptional regulator [Acinetobacter gerneri]MDV2441306.1 AraC family transcriptional regulator [Acinetobacter gerneri]
MKNMIQNESLLLKSEGQNAFEAISTNPNAHLIESIFHEGRPLFAIWETENAKVIEPFLEEICLSYHISGSIRVRNNVIGQNNVKFNSISIYGKHGYEWNIYNKLIYAQIYFWDDLLQLANVEKPISYELNHLHGIRDNWIDGLFRMILSYQDIEQKKQFILKMYHDCFQHIHQQYLTQSNAVKQNQIGGITSFQVGKLQQYIDENYSKNINIDDFCQEMNWSRSHLFREFKKTFGTTPYNFLVHKRIDMAKKLLLQGLNITQVCLKTGIENPSKLNYFFNKYVGMSPKLFIEIYLKNSCKLIPQDLDNKIE